MWISEILDDKGLQELLVIHSGTSNWANDPFACFTLIPYSELDTGEHQLQMRFMLKEDPCHSVACPSGSQLLGPASMH